MLTQRFKFINKTWRYINLSLKKILFWFLYPLSKRRSNKLRQLGIPSFPEATASFDNWQKSKNTIKHLETLLKEKQDNENTSIQIANIKSILFLGITLKGADEKYHFFNFQEQEALKKIYNNAADDCTKKEDLLLSKLFYENKSNEYQKGIENLQLLRSHIEKSKYEKFYKAFCTIYTRKKERGFWKGLFDALIPVSSSKEAEEKTKDMMVKYKSAQTSLIHLMQEEYSTGRRLLEFAKLATFKNIYMGALILNVIRQNAGGGNIQIKELNEIESTLFDMSIMQRIQKIQTQIPGSTIEISGQAISDILGDVINGIPTKEPGNILGHILTDVGNMIENLNTNIEKHKQIQEELASTFTLQRKKWLLEKKQMIQENEFTTALIDENIAFEAIFHDIIELIQSHTISKQNYLQYIEELESFRKAIISLYNCFTFANQKFSETRVEKLLNNK